MCTTAQRKEREVARGQNGCREDKVGQSSWDSRNGRTKQAAPTGHGATEALSRQLFALDKEVALRSLVHAQILVQVEHVKVCLRRLLLRLEEEEDPSDEWSRDWQDEGEAETAAK